MMPNNVATNPELSRALHRIAELETEVTRLRHTNGNGHANGEANGNGHAASALEAMPLIEVEGMLVRRAMERSQGNVSRAARALGLSRSALYRRLERHKI